MVKERHPKTANKIAKRLNVDIKDIFIFIEEKEGLNKCLEQNCKIFHQKKIQL